MMLFYLSNKQKKDLFVRGTQIEVALPAPDDFDGLSVKDWAILHIEQSAKSLVVDADECEVRVLVAQRKVHPECLADLIGGITESPHVWSIGVAVVAVTIRPTDCRHRSSRLQWAHHAFDTEKKKRFPSSVGGDDN